MSNYLFVTALVHFLCQYPSIAITSKIAEFNTLFAASHWANLTVNDAKFSKCRLVSLEYRFVYEEDLNAKEKK